MTSLRKLSASFLGTASLCLLNLTPCSVNFSSSREFESQKIVEINDFAELQRLDWYDGNDRWFHVSESIVPPSYRDALLCTALKARKMFFTQLLSESNWIFTLGIPTPYYIPHFFIILWWHSALLWRHINLHFILTLSQRLHTSFWLSNFPVVGNWMTKKKPTKRGASE